MPAPAPPHHSNLGQILNDEEPKPLLILDDALVTALHEKLVHSTSGCSLEQLEQINAALMDAIWKHRSDWNRNVVLKEVTEAFNIIIRDIQAMQDILKSSQEEDEEDQRRVYGTQFTQPDWFSQAPR
jgi:transcriptional regulator of heat shock response